jgi:alanine-glyoxylate transaminase / serine-glyoxylate transaminase / serine-pyruvate transaminase
VTVPEGVDEANVRKRLLNDFNIEIGAGLGPLKGKIWRVGLMGETSSRANIRMFLSSLGQILNDSGRKTDTAAALSAAA